MQTQVGIPKPHPSVYENYGRTTFEKLAKEAKFIPILTKVVYARSGGILTYRKGNHYPTKGFPDPQAMSEINVAKSNLMSLLNILFNKHTFPMLLVYTFYPWKKKIQVLETVTENLVRTMDKGLEHLYLHKMYYTNIGKGLRQLTYLFLHGIGMRKKLASHVGKILTTLVDPDDTYRLRVVDIFSIIDKRTLMDDPRAELLRAERIFNEREYLVEMKFNYFFKALRLLMFIPRCKRAFVHAVKLTDIASMGYDDIDRYATLTRGGYDFQGRLFDSRFREFILLHPGGVPMYQVLSAKKIEENITHDNIINSEENPQRGNTTMSEDTQTPVEETVAPVEAPVAEPTVETTPEAEVPTTEATPAPVEETQPAA